MHHINPSEGIEMMKAVQAQKAVPIHFGTFQLTVEMPMDPTEWLEQENEGIDFKACRTKTQQRHAKHKPCVPS